MTHWAVPGVQCVCIDDDFGCIRVGDLCIPNRQPMINEVLTVKIVEITDEGVVILTFEEIEERQSDSKDGKRIAANIYWHADCFRPLIKRKTDISIFTAMLTPAGRLPVDA